MIAYGINLSTPDKICGNPVVIKSDTHEIAQPVGFYFQVFGHDRPLTSKIIVREVTLENDRRSETIIKTIREVTIQPTIGRNITIGKARMDLTPPLNIIDPSKVYTAEIILDEGTGGELHSKQIEIPFSQLVSFFPNTIVLDKEVGKFGSANQNADSRSGVIQYGLAGDVENGLISNRRNKPTHLRTF